MHKYTIEELQEFIEIQSNSSCKLLSKEYKDCKTKLSIKCSCGNDFKTTFDSFKNKNKRQCNECTDNERKLKLKDIKQYCKNNIDGYTVLDIRHEKKNGRHSSFALIKCPNKDHQPYWVKWEKVLIGQRCQRCYKATQNGRALKWNGDNILELLNKFELTIVDTNYKFKNSRHKILCRNKDGYLVDVNILTLAQNNNPHPFQMNKYAIDNLKLFCNKMGYKLMPNQVWKGIKHKYVIETEEGYKSNTFIETLMLGSYPRPFHPSNPFSIKNINLYCKKNRPDYVVISNEYKGKDKKLLFKYVGNKANMTEEERCFKVTLEAFILNNQEHPWFNQSKGETVIERWLIKNKILYEREYTFKDCKKVNELRFDFAIFRDGKLRALIEYQGIQHYEAVEHFGGVEKLKIQRINDKIKSNYCSKNNIPLLVIPYWELKKINDILHHNLYSQ